MIPGKPAPARSSARTSNGAKSLTRASGADWDQPPHSTIHRGRTPSSSRTNRARSATRAAGAQAPRTGRRKSPAGATPGSSISARTWSVMSASPRAGPAGTSIALRHARDAQRRWLALHRKSPARRWPPTRSFSAAQGRETFEPHFTFHGFRYVEDHRLSRKTHRRRSSRRRGRLRHCRQPARSNAPTPNLNRLYQNIVWGQRGNFLSVPTDCPQRDERMGWMGDAQVFAPTAARNADVAAFFTKWMVDVDDGQSAHGDYCRCLPAHRPAPAGDAGVGRRRSHHSLGDVHCLRRQGLPGGQLSLHGAMG